MAGDKNNRKKVLVVTYYWPPSGGAGVQRFLKFVKYFPANGIDPVILTCANPTYPIQDSSLHADIPDGVPVYYSRTLEPFRFYGKMTGATPEEAANPATILDSEKSASAKSLTLIQRAARWLRANLFVPDARIGWVPFAQSLAKKIIKEHGIETVITTGPPHSTHFTGRMLKRKTGVRWVADFRDPWTDIHYNRALPRTFLTKKIDAAMEASVLKEADEITVTAPGTARFLSNKVPRHCHIITNGFDPDDFDSDPASTQSPSKDSKRPFIIRHIGSITETSIPENLLKALSRFNDDEVQMAFIGVVHPDVTSYIAAYGLENRVTCSPYVPHREATALMCGADMNVVVVHRSDESRILIPGKLYDYLNARKPVMVIGPPDGDAANIVRTCRIGEAFDYGDSDGPEAWIRKIASARNISGTKQARHETGLPVSSENDKERRATSKTEKTADAFLPFSPDRNEIEKYSRPNLTKAYSRILLEETSG